MTIAIQMQSLVVGWQMYELTHDPLALGLIGLAEAIPFISIALYSGHIADLYNRRTIILIFIAFFLVGSCFLFTFTIKNLGILASFGVLPIYLVIVISGFSRAFIYPATVALMAQIVPRELYPNSSTWNSMTWNIAAITGPAVGGLVYGFFGVQVAYGAVIATGLTSLLLLSFVKSVPPPPVVIVEKLYQRVKSGLKFVLKNQVLLSAMSLDMFGVLFGGAVAMLRLFAGEVLKVGPQGLGFLRAAPMAGAVIMSLFLAYRPPMARAGRLLILGVTGFGLSIILFAISRNFYLSIALLFLSGMADSISVVIRATTLQLLTPDEMRGRVASVNSIFIGSSNEIGSFESGVAAKIMGLIPSVIFGGGMTLLIVAVTSRLAPKLRKLNLRHYA
jgi:MFS family permease